MKRSDFYQTHLNNVSRSFAFCIKQMADPQREWIGLAYILCRLIDTVEDSRWKSQAAQLNAFDEFADFLKKSPSLERIRAWQASLPGALPKGERALVASAHRFISDFHALPEVARKSIAGSVLSMTRGMKYFCQNYLREGRFRLNFYEETNQYCFYVAGVVGELLTGLMQSSSNHFKISADSWSLAFHFGFFLQKINILKDQLEDESQGRHFLPNRDRVVASLPYHAQKALSYVQSIPVEERPFRLFCSWSLFLGLASMPWIERSWRERQFMKIPRTEALKVVQKVESLIDDNLALQDLFQSLMSALPLVEMATPKLDKSLVFPPFLKFYTGRLRVTDFLELEMLPAETAAL